MPNQEVDRIVIEHRKIVSTGNQSRSASSGLIEEFLNPKLTQRWLRYDWPLLGLFDFSRSPVSYPSLDSVGSVLGIVTHGKLGPHEL
jgi:hypothetical protein